MNGSRTVNCLPLFLLAFLLGVPKVGYGCAAVGMDGMPIRTTDESALIVWNAKSGVEHFVRRASFESGGKDFGFLVPTPSRPELGEANDELFDDLEKEILPKAEHLQWARYAWTFLMAGRRIRNTFSKSSDNMWETAGNGAVEVIEQKRVANYEATILRSNSAKSLERWLQQNNYRSGADFREWVKPYLGGGWFVTAFKIASDSGSGMATARAVRLSFKTKRPFFPYREPRASQKMRGFRTLRVFYLGATRPQARIEEGAKVRMWPAQTQYSAPLATTTGFGFPLERGALRLTAFLDSSAPRPGWGDLNFLDAPQQGRIVPTPYIVWDEAPTYIPLDLAVILGITVWYALVARQKRAQNFSS